MSRIDESRRRGRVAIASSVALHGCVLAALIAIPTAPEGTATERVTGMPILVVQRSRPQPTAVPTPPPLVAAGSVQTPAPTVNRVIRVLTANAHRSAKTAPVARPRAASAPDRIPVQSAPTAPTAQVAVLATAAPADVATATPSPVPATPAPPTAEPGTSGLFGQNYHAMPNPPEALRTLVASVAQHLRLRVHVSESGRATSVDFLTPIADAAVAEALRAKILALSYVPADCNGLRCEDDLEIRF